MTNRQIDNRIKKLQELERQRKEIEQKENELKAEIKRDLESKDIEELQTGNFIVRWKTMDIYSHVTKEKSTEIMNDLGNKIKIC